MYKKKKIIVFLSLFLLCIPINRIIAYEIYVINADTVWSDTLLHSTELENITSNALPRILVEHSNLMYNFDFSHFPSELDSLTAQISITQRLLIQFAENTFQIDLISKSIPVGIEEKETKNHSPSDFSLFQNYPNPFNPKTTIRFTIPKSSSVKLVLYDIVGRKVATLLNKDLNPGGYKVDFYASGLESGLYIYRLQAEGFVQSKKLILLK